MNIKGKDAVERMKGFFGVSTEEALQIGSLLLEVALIGCKIFANTFRGDNTKYYLNYVKLLFFLKVSKN